VATTSFDKAGCPTCPQTECFDPRVRSIAAPTCYRAARTARCPEESDGASCTRCARSTGAASAPLASAPVTTERVIRRRVACDRITSTNRAARRQTWRPNRSPPWQARCGTRRSNLCLIPASPADVCASAKNRKLMKRKETFAAQTLLIGARRIGVGRVRDAARVLVGLGAVALRLPALRRARRSPWQSRRSA
jgi:hypothetical protein